MAWKLTGFLLVGCTSMWKHVNWPKCPVMFLLREDTVFLVLLLPSLWKHLHSGSQIPIYCSGEGMGQADSSVYTWSGMGCWFLFFEAVVHDSASLELPGVRVIWWNGESMALHGCLHGGSVDIYVLRKGRDTKQGWGQLWSPQPPPSCIGIHSHTHGDGWDTSPWQDGKLGVPSLARGWELLFNWVEPWGLCDGI